MQLFYPAHGAPRGAISAGGDARSINPCALLTPLPEVGPDQAHKSPCGPNLAFNESYKPDVALGEWGQVSLTPLL